MSKITYPVAKDASCVKHCPECGRVHTGRAAVLPGEPGAVCLAVTSRPENDLDLCAPGHDTEGSSMRRTGP
jgi:hypothetical protein